MNLHIQLFAGLVDLFGTSVLHISLEQETVTIEQLKQRIADDYPHAAQQLVSCFFAKNQAYAGDADAVTEQDELALIPPVSGGQPELYEITHEEIDAGQVAKKVNHPNHGASLLFIGTTREMTHGQRTVLLEYEAYIPMAVKTMAAIGQEIGERWPGTLCAITHRLGKVAIAEASVVIAVSSPHRPDCYEASRYAIERLKQIVPIWKKEIWEDGSEWKGSQTGPWNPLLTPQSD
ncbi:molybdenum cofactor biosynthesis protein MoaE [Paenibacillus sp. GCM10023248]|uniref:molybdenum cofactor biosynthesis protein n=1 Tax=Bacillales TaxID=1385 RepID=UPI00237852FD|nr:MULTISPECIES: molybdenum cofactor biosynthesis protein MoaE [Bacillales]MDD9265955.1 molybdenum cofactor biosynthesis protein MoaE [Paenibacillus sp. MAHUQ-63]MDR6879194.1 molybdopterin synthase catalytic subunit [Bacillus sp. 3255]